MRITDFDVYSELLKEKSGLMLDADQSYLLDSRLGPIAKKWGYPSLALLTVTLQGVPDRDLVRDVVEAMTTKDTSFFRDVWPFHMFRDEVLDYFAKKKGSQRKLRIWCAGVSTGQEAYSLAMLLKDKGSAFSNWKIEILATDLSNEPIEQARHGLYSQFEVQRGLPVTTLLKRFSQLGDGQWQINNDLRKMVKFQTFNMLDNMASLGQFDVIFCRNVLSGFEKKTAHKVFEKLSGQLEKDGFLFLGKNETAPDSLFLPLSEKRGVYVPKDSQHLAAGQPLAKTRN